MTCNNCKITTLKDEEERQDTRKTAYSGGKWITGNKKGMLPSVI